MEVQREEEQEEREEEQEEVGGGVVEVGRDGYPKRKPKHQQARKKDGAMLQEPHALFDEDKSEALKQLRSGEEDRSRAGHVDDDAVGWVEQFNSRRHIYTVSSCAGRIILTLQHQHQGYDVPWCFVSHKCPTHPNDVVQAVHKTMEEVKKNPPQGDWELWLRGEGPILAIVCSGWGSWERVWQAARRAGMKRGGAQGGERGGRGVVAGLVDTGRVEALIATMQDGILVDTKYIERLVACANEKLEKGRKRFDALTQEIIKALPEDQKKK